jgi:tellurite resistance protein TerC
MQTIGNPLLLGIFFAVVLAMLALDLFVAGGGRQHKVSFRESAVWTLVWVGVSLLFAGGLWFWLEATQGRAIADARTMEYLTGYLLEKSLAIDNLFVWLMIFTHFGVPSSLQKRVLVYGIFGALILRTLMILIGAALIARFHWILYFFGAFLLYTGVKMAWFADAEPDLENNALLLWVRRHIRITPALHGERFFVRFTEAGHSARHATPLLLVLILVEISDIVFAVDSIPAVFAVTTDPFIVLTSNIFAILGLRAMYFMLAGMADRFSLLKYGLAAVLMFVGVKMLLMDVYQIPTGFSLAVIATLIGTSVWLSLRHAARKMPHE